MVKQAEAAENGGDGERTLGGVLASLEEAFPGADLEAVVVEFPEIALGKGWIVQSWEEGEPRIRSAVDAECRSGRFGTLGLDANQAGAVADSVGVNREPGVPGKIVTGKTPKYRRLPDTSPDGPPVNFRH